MAFDILTISRTDAPNAELASVMTQVQPALGRHERVQSGSCKSLCFKCQVCVDENGELRNNDSIKMDNKEEQDWINLALN